MTQYALPLFPNAPQQPGDAPAAAGSAGLDAVGFEIGWDYAHHRLTPPADHLHGTHPVRQGWEAGRAAFGARTLQPTRHVRNWLALRLKAWVDGVPFEGVMLTPRYLSQIEPLHCPVTRELLTHGADLPTDAVVMRLDPAAGYAAGHLVTVSRRVARARGAADAAQAADIARRLQAGDCSTVGGLDATQWLRLSSLLGLAIEQPHERLAAEPLRVLPPNRVRLLNPVQALQVVLTQLFTGEAYARRMATLGTLMPHADARRCYFLFMNAMLARRLAAGWSADRAHVRTALEDAWSHPVIQRRWAQLSRHLSRTACERIVRLAAQRGLTGGWRWLDDDAATEGWHAVPRRPHGPQAGAVFGTAAASGASTPQDAAGALSLRRWQRVAPSLSAAQVEALAA